MRFVDCLKWFDMLSDVLWWVWVIGFSILAVVLILGSLIKDEGIKASLSSIGAFCGLAAAASLGWYLSIVFF